jgi:hypothetical protein
MSSLSRFRTKTLVVVCAIAGTLVLTLIVGLVTVWRSRSTMARTPVTSDVPSVPGRGDEPERISAEDRAAFLAALRNIDPGLVADEERAAHHGVQTCLDILEGVDDGNPGEMERLLRLRFAHSGVSVSPSQAKKIVKAVKLWCGSP